MFYELLASRVVTKVVTTPEVTTLVTSHQLDKVGPLLTCIQRVRRGE